MSVSMRIGAATLTNISHFMATPECVEAAGTASEPLVWYIVRTNPVSERRALEGLIERGFSAYMPCETRWHKGLRGVKERRQRPLCHGYLFVGLTPRQSIYDVRRTDGVHGLLGVNGRPTEIARSEIDKIQRRELAGEFNYTLDRKAAKAAVREFKAKWGDLRDLGAEQAVATIMAALEPEKIDEAA